MNEEENATTDIEAVQEDVVTELRALAEAQNTGWKVSDVARARADGIDQTRAYLSDHRHRIAFVGQIGIGKSAMITVLTRLLVGDPPKDKATLRENSVLALGAGGTTVCEVRVRASSDNDEKPYGLIIDPLSVEEMRTEIRLFAHDEWARRHTRTRAKVDDEQDPTPREVQRAIREMTNLPLRKATVTDKGQKRRDTADPIDDLIKTHDNADALANDLVERANLLSRTDTQWWWSKKADALQNMKQRFHDVNHGRAPTAMLPRRITLVVPKPLPGLKSNLDIEIIDTRGFDGRLAGRLDIQDVLRDSRALVVLCTPFREAPGEAVKTLLSDIQADAVLRAATERILLMLLDHGDGEAVNGAEGDRSFGQDLKLRECETSLTSAGLGIFAQGDQMGVFDALSDDRKAMVALLESRLEAVRTAAQRRLRQQVEDAQSFLGNLENERIALARAEVDRRLITTIQANLPGGAPLRDPLEGIYDAIRGCRYASQVYASCRRSGVYWALEAYGSARSGASRAATDWLAKFHTIMTGALNALEHDSALADAIDHIRLRRNQYEQGYIEAIDRYADTVGANVRSTLYLDQVWQACENEWGQGHGFKERVIQHLTRWSRTQDELTAHERAELAGLLPIASDAPDDMEDEL